MAFFSMVQGGELITVHFAAGSMYFPQHELYFSKAGISNFGNCEFVKYLTQYLIVLALKDICKTLKKERQNINNIIRNEASRTSNT